jgi:hypothetical protein
MYILCVHHLRKSFTLLHLLCVQTMAETSKQGAASASASENSSSGQFSSGKQFFGHPFGLSVLFFTEFWERFSYYGMRAILLLFLTAPALASPELQNVGLGFDTATAGFIYGLYTSMAYLAAVPGGWIADNLLGQRRAVLLGGILIAAWASVSRSGSALDYFGNRFAQAERQRDGRRLV